MFELGEEVVAEFGKEEMDQLKDSRETTWQLHGRREMFKGKVVTSLSAAELSGCLNTKIDGAQQALRLCSFIFCFCRSCTCVFY